MKKVFRPGILGALMDEYERAFTEFAEFVAAIPENDFIRIVDRRTPDEDCRSVQTVVSHVVNSAYSYADYIREIFGIPSERPARVTIHWQDVPNKIKAVLEYTQKTLEGRWQLSEDEIFSAVIHARWGGKYHLEQMFEHAIVHVLRHRRQITKFIHRGDIRITV